MTYLYDIGVFQAFNGYNQDLSYADSKRFDYREAQAEDA